MASPEVGSSIYVSIQLDGRTFVVPATVAYVDRVQGFGVRFTPSESAGGLARWSISAPPNGPRFRVIDEMVRSWL